MVIEKFNAILAKERTNDLIPFLKSLSNDDRKKLAPELKKLSKEYLDYQMVTSLTGTTSYKQKASIHQHEILYAAAFVVLNRKEYEKFDQFRGLIQNGLLPEVLSWHCPDWFSDMINDMTKSGWMPWNFTYDVAMDFTDKGYLTPSDELIVRLIPQIIFERGKDHKYSYVPQKLTHRDITLRQHIWLIFQYETGIHSSDRYMQFHDADKVDNRWLHTLKTFADEGRIDRLRILKESILASSRNFNKSLSGWFIDLFDVFQPDQTELIAIQPEMYIALNSQHSKAINSILNSLKKIADAQEFDVKSLLENIPLLLSSEVKSVVSSALLLLEKIARKHPNQREQICVGICQAFIHADETIQNKAVKLVLKFHSGSLSVTNELNSYCDSMLMSSRKALAEFLTSEQGQSFRPEAKIDAPSIVNPLQEIQTLDELIFLASQAFDNNDPLHIDLLPAAFVNLQDQLSESALTKFEPALQRAYNLVMGDWPSTMGYLDHLLATFFIDLTWLLVERFPKAGASLQLIHGRFKLKEDENKAKWSWYTGKILELKTWAMHTRDTTYVIHKSILITAYEKIKNREQSPILSTPTHECGYVDPIVLVKRLSQCATKNVLPDVHDFQLAICRIASFNHHEALKLARACLKGETLGILEFLLTEGARPVPPFTTSSLWFTAGVAKSPSESFIEFNSLYYSSLPRSIFTGDIAWRSSKEHYTISRYNFGKKKNENVPAEQKVLRVTINPPIETEGEAAQERNGILSKLSKIFTQPLKKSSREETYIIHEFLSMKGKFLSAEQNDIKRFIYLFPRNPNPLLALVTDKSLVYGTFASETDKKMVTRTFEGLMNLKFQFSEITHLFVATSLLTSDKTVRSFAAEMWINAIKSSNVDSVQLGRIIGIHLGVEYAPLKRFTDIVSTNLLQISSLHNRELEVLLNSSLLHLPGEPPVGTKRLLEIFSEVLAVNNSSVKTEEVKNKLALWSTSSSLKKVISSMVKS